MAKIALHGPQALPVASQGGSEGMKELAPFSSWTAASPYAVVLVAALVCIVCAIVGWRRRSLPGGSEAAIAMTAAAVWAVFYAFELTDPKGLFNAELAGNQRRAIEFRVGDRIDEGPPQILVSAAISYNRAKRKK